MEPDPNFLSNTAKILKEVGAKVIKGDFEFTEIAIPPSMLSQYTRLEILTFENQVLIKYLAQAAQTRDPVERMKLVVSGYVFAAHQIANLCPAVVLLGGKAPVPAANGDKLEGVDSAGNRILVHHDTKKQTVTSIKAEGVDQAFVLATEWENVVKVKGMNLSNINGKKANPIQIVFKDSAKYSIVQTEL